MRSKSVFPCIVLSLALCVCGSVFGTGVPEDAFPQEERQQLQSAKFVQLKHDVSTYLSKHCSQEKVNLLMDLIVLTRPRRCVEVGVFKGSSTLPIVATLQYLHAGILYAIDAWSTTEVVRYVDPADPHAKRWSKINMKKAKRRFERLLEEWRIGKRCTIIAEPSKKAASKIKKQIDFLHLDGGWSEKASLTDVQLYLPKVKSNGYILFSNIFFAPNSKKKAFSALFDACDVVCEIDNGDTVLFQKR